MHPFLSVIVTAYNEGEYLLEAVRSVQQQKFSALEIIVVDDGSTGRTKEVVESLIHEPKVRIIRQVNQGPSAARNTGLRHARGKYAGFLDGDDVWLPDKADSHLEILESHTGIDLTFAMWRLVDEDRTDTGRRGNPARAYPIKLEDLIKRNCVGPPSNVIGRKEAFFAAGLFDENLRFAEDMEFWIRVARLRDGNLYYIPTVLMDYRLREGQLSKNWRNMFLNWQKVIAKVRKLEPERVEAVEHEAYAIAKRYLAYLAYEAKDYSDARGFLWEALWIKPGFLIDPGSFFTIAAILSTYLPEIIHESLAKGVQQMRKKLTT